ncbi:MAG: hypothetical protein M1825_005139 [Sarcosagium campestre]|nr:MAG: hypothetical protein M1825_005139 [Sarcosagium campestre]
MVLLGVSVLLVSLSFLIYRHPPRKWSAQPLISFGGLLGFLSKSDPSPGQQNAGDSGGDGAADHDLSRENDRKLMPPPQIPSQPSPTTPKASALSGSRAPPLPSFNLPTLDNNADSPTTTFPSLNSAQRASGPPRLAPLPSTRGSMLPPPPRPTLSSSLRAAPSRSSSLALPPTITSKPVKPRTKVQLAAGHSPLDWARLQHDPAMNLRGLPHTRILRISRAQLRRHKRRPDVWSAFGGRVYNISPYLPFHPGGEAELLRAAGREGDKLFMEIHPWVNWENMLAECLVGILVDDGDGEDEGQGNRNRATQSIPDSLDDLD